MVSFKKQLGLFITVFLMLVLSISFVFADDCRDVGCHNLKKKIGKCRRNLAIQEFCGNKRPGFCCCSKKKISTSTCDPIGCSKGCEVCSQGKRRLTFYTNDTEPIVFPFGGSRSLGFSCCCPNGIANIEAIMCQDIQPSCQASSSVEPRCSSDQKFASFDIYVKDEAISESSPVISSSSGCPIPLPPSSDCDIGTIQRTISCCCR